MHSRRLSGSDDGAEVLGIFHAVENHEERRFALLACQLKNVLRAAVGLGRDKGDNPLMIAARNQAVEGRRRLDMDRNALGLGLFHEVSELPISPQDEETLERTSCRLARLRERHATHTAVRADYRFQRLVPSGLSSMMMPCAASDFLISSAFAKSFRLSGLIRVQTIFASISSSVL